MYNKVIKKRTTVCVFPPRCWLLFLFSRSTGFLNMFSHNVVSTVLVAESCPRAFCVSSKWTAWLTIPLTVRWGARSNSECPKFETCRNLSATDRSVWWYCNEWKKCEKIVRNVQQWANKCARWNSTRTPITHHSEHLA